MDLAHQIKENESLARLMRDKRGTALIEFKGGVLDLQRKADIYNSTISSAGADYTTSGVIQIGRSPAIMPGPRERVWLRNLLTVVPTDSQVVDFVKVETDVTNASPAAEGGAKLENQLTLTPTSISTRTIATVKTASRQILDDLPGLQGFIETSMAYALLKEEQDQLLTGNNTGEELNGFVTQATAFDTTKLVAGDGWDYIDYLGRSAQLLEEANENPPNFCAMHPTTYWNIRLQKNSSGEYLYGPPNVGDAQFTIFGMTPFRTANLATTQFLVGSTSPADAVIRDRMSLRVEIARSHDSDFISNLVTIRVEERVALCVFNPAAFRSGTFSQSPA